MRIWAWTMTYWNDAADAQGKFEEWLGLRTWHERVQLYFRPTHCFVACGTWSEPRYSRLPSEVAVVNAGVPRGTPYDVYYTQLSGCAFTTAMAYALNRSDEWDMLVFLDTDTLVGAVDFGALLNEFASRSEVLLAQSWWGGIGGPFYVWKHAGAVRLLHGAHRANFIERPANPKADKPMLMEHNLAATFKGVVWLPWPQETMRQDFGLTDPFADTAAVMTWPFVSRPDPAIQAEYERTQTVLAKPVQA